MKPLSIVIDPIQRRAVIPGVLLHALRAHVIFARLEVSRQLPPDGLPIRTHMPAVVPHAHTLLDIEC
ncbi:MAG: hypothetical protein QF437_09200, partial [Planctomycetota bacterium]|nr:hypothetical protein [Planctomycetota bacterium]